MYPIVSDTGSPKLSWIKGSYHCSSSLHVQKSSAFQFSSKNNKECAHDHTLYNIWLVGWLSGRTSVSDRRTFTGLHRTCR